MFSNIYAQNLKVSTSNHKPNTTHTMNFYKEWFENPQWWFDPKNQYDEYICQRFGHLLDDPSTDLPHILILIYDQLPRHIYRNQCANHIITYFLQKALYHLNNIYPPDHLSGNELCFAMLPLRHTNDSQSIFKAMLCCWILENPSFSILSKHLIISSNVICAPYKHLSEINENFMQWTGI